MTNINDYREKKEKEKKENIEKADEEVETATNILMMKKNNGILKEEDILEWAKAVGRAHEQKDENK